MPKAYTERERRAELVRAADDALAEVVAKIKKRGVNHPYVKNYVLARTTPLSRARKTLPSFEQTFERLRENLEAFDPAKVRMDEIARSAMFAARRVARRRRPRGAHAQAGRALGPPAGLPPPTPSPDVAVTALAP